MFCKFSANCDIRNSVHKACIALAYDRVPEAPTAVPSCGSLLQELRASISLGFFKKKLKSHYSSLGSHTAIM